MIGSDTALDPFLNGFSARDLAEPLRSFDETTAVNAVRAVLDTELIGVSGVRRSGKVAGWFTREDVADSQESLPCRLFEPGTVIADSAPFNEVVRGLNSELCLFVRSFGQVSGLIQRDDLQKPPMRMWLFGLVTISELRVTRLIDELCPQGAWQRYLSPSRLKMAHDLQDERSRRGQHRELLDCLQFADKGRIVARDESLRARTRFGSRRQVEDFVKALQDLRNNLAHSQDIVGDWDVIHELATNLHRIVLGTPADSAGVGLITS